jgi:hypothetical protein
VIFDSSDSQLSFISKSAHTPLGDVELISRIDHLLRHVHRCRIFSTRHTGP